MELEAFEPVDLPAVGHRRTSSSSSSGSIPPETDFDHDADDDEEVPALDKEVWSDDDTAENALSCCMWEASVTARSLRSHLPCHVAKLRCLIAGAVGL